MFILIFLQKVLNSSPIMLALLWIHITRHLIQSANTMTALTANHPLSATNKLLSKTTKYPQAFVLEIQNISSVASKHSSLGVISAPEPQCIALPLTLVKIVSWLYSTVHYSIHSLPHHDCNTVCSTTGVRFLYYCISVVKTTIQQFLFYRLYRNSLALNISFCFYLQ